MQIQRGAGRGPNGSGLTGGGGLPEILNGVYGVYGLFLVISDL